MAPLETLPAPAETTAFGILGIDSFEPIIMAAFHWHGHIEANFCANARLNYAFEGAQAQVPANKTALFWAGIPHRLDAVESEHDQRPLLTNLYLPLDLFLAMPNIGPLQIALLAGGMIALPDPILNHSQLIRWRKDLESGDAELRAILLQELTASLRRLTRVPFDYLRQPFDLARPRKSNIASQSRPVVQMVRFVLDNIEKPLTSASVTAVTGLHMNYALTLFSRVMGIPLGQFVIRIRLLRARSMLTESDRSIAAIAHACGFQSMSQFYHHFTKNYGHSPGRIRCRLGALHPG